MHFQQVGIFVEAPPVAGLFFVQLARRFGLKEVGEVVHLVLRIEMDVNDQLLLLGFRLGDARGPEGKGIVGAQRGGPTARIGVGLLPAEGAIVVETYMELSCGGAVNAAERGEFSLLKLKAQAVGCFADQVGNVCRLHVKEGLEKTVRRAVEELKKTANIRIAWRCPSSRRCKYLRRRSRSTAPPGRTSATRATPRGSLPCAAARDC